MFEKHENLFNVLFEAASEGIIVVDEAQIIVASNAAAAKMFGYEREKRRRGSVKEPPLHFGIVY